jgi:hypothetical protein
MGRLMSLPDEEEARGSNPRAPTIDVQGFLPRHPPPRPPAAAILQPKWLHLGVHWRVWPGLNGNDGVRFESLRQSDRFDVISIELREQLLRGRAEAAHALWLDGL